VSAATNFFLVILWLWKKAIESYQRCIKERMLQVSEELLQISILGRDLEQLKDVSIIDKNGNVLKDKTLKDRFKERFTDEGNPERFEKAIYEIQIWNNLTVDILGHPKKKNCGILIKSQKDPVQNDEKEIMKKIKEMINSKNLPKVSKLGKYEIVVFEIVPSVVFTPTYGWAQIEHMDFFYSLIFPHPVSQLLYDTFKYPSLPMDKRGDGLIWNRLICYGAF